MRNSLLEVEVLKKVGGHGHYRPWINRINSLYEKDKKMLPVSVFSDETHAGAPELCHYFVGDHLKCLNYVDYLSEILINLVII